MIEIVEKYFLNEVNTEERRLCRTMQLVPQVRVRTSMYRAYSKYEVYKMTRMLELLETTW